MELCSDPSPRYAGNALGYGRTCAAVSPSFDRTPGPTGMRQEHGEPGMIGGGVL